DRARKLQSACRGSAEAPFHPLCKRVVTRSQPRDLLGLRFPVRSRIPIGFLDFGGIVIDAFVGPVDRFSGWFVVDFENNRSGVVHLVASCSSSSSTTAPSSWRYKSTSGL